jgi:hypothetical protein
MLILDTECYSDFFLLSFLDHTTRKIAHFEMYPGKALDRAKIGALMGRHTTISFNGLSYDLPMITAALSGYSNAQLKLLSDSIIKTNAPSWRVCRDNNISVPPQWDHIDLIEVAPGTASLKMYGGRMHMPTIQDLPIDEAATVPPEQRETMRLYCENDLFTTGELFDRLRPSIELRAAMSNQYDEDLRSKSDAQIAETVIKSELSKITGDTYRAPKLPDDYGFYYQDPEIIEFENPSLRKMFSRILETRFSLGVNGSVAMPDWLKNERIKIGGAEYQMGIGGLHSCEQAQFVSADAGHCLADFDVASYYPSIILQQRLAPKRLGEPFLRVYQSLVTRRLQAKHAGNKTEADTLKIVVNGSFGKLGSKYSALYAPDLLIQTTLTGQLALLMLIERMADIGVRVVSANTDGVVLYYPRAIEASVEGVAWEWMLDTSYELERTDYLCIASRDVNNYVAVKLDGKTKGKGVFAATGLSKNPDCQIIYDAVAAHVATGEDITDTITLCRDVARFVTVRRVQGGATWRGEYLGKTVRFYHSSAITLTECISYAINSNKVPTSDGCRPLMTLPDDFPEDIDFGYYITEAEKLLCEIGL